MKNTMDKIIETTENNKSKIPKKVIEINKNDKISLVYDL